MRKKDKKGNIIIKLTEGQYYWLLRFFNREWDEEVNYRLEEGAHDVSYLKDLLGVYRALLGTPACGIAEMIDYEDLKGKIKDLEEVKGEKENN